MIHLDALLLVLGVLISLAIVAHADEAPRYDPFSSYVAGGAPKIARDITSEERGTVTLQRMTYLSRTVKTDNGDRDTLVYAAMAMPKAKGRYPGLLILHGGGSNALDELAVNWARRGYVVLTIDQPGICSPKVEYSSGYWKDFSYSERLFTVLPDLTVNCAVFDALVADIQAVRLLQAQPKVDVRHLGIMGYSWGGSATTFLCGLLSKDITASISYFGTGNFDKGTFAIGEFAKHTPQEKELWLTNLDAGRRAGSITSAFMQVSPTNDTFFQPPAVMATLAEIRRNKNQVFAANLDHTYPGISYAECSTGDAGALETTFFAYYLQRMGHPLPQATLRPALRNADGTLTVHARIKESHVKIVSATVNYANSSAHWQHRKWTVAAATVTDQQHVQATIPASVEYFFTIVDERGVKVSTLIAR